MVVSGQCRPGSVRLQSSDSAMQGFAGEQSPLMIEKQAIGAGILDECLNLLIGLPNQDAALSAE